VTQLLVEAVGATRAKSNKKMKGLLSVRMQEYMLSSGYEEAISTLPRSVSDRYCLSIVVATLCDFLEEVIKEEIRKVRPLGKSAPSRGQELAWADRPTVVNRVFGWAILELAFKLDSDRTRATALCKAQLGVSDTGAVRAVLSSFTISHWEAMDDENYFERYYSEAMQLQNKGGLRLVCAEMFGFGSHLVSRIARFSEVEVKKRGPSALQEALDTIVGAVHLREQFWNGAKRLGCEEGSDRILEFLYETLIKKVFHAMVGRETKSIARDLCGNYSKNAKGDNMPFRQRLKFQSNPRHNKRQKVSATATAANGNKGTKIDEDSNSINP